MFIYYNGRVNPDPKDMNKFVNKNTQKAALEDRGSKSRTAIHSLLMQGVCKEELWPYGVPSSNKTTKVFDKLDIKPSPVEPEDWDKVVFQAKGSSHPMDWKDLSHEPDIIPKAISYYRIFNPLPAGASGPAEQ